MGEIKEFEKNNNHALEVHSCMFCDEKHTRADGVWSNFSGVCQRSRVCPSKVSSSDVAQSGMGGGEAESKRKEDDDST